MNACGYGKVILFGEQFVVYGIPAIASALDLKVEAKIADASGGIYADDLLSGRKVTYKKDSAPILDLMPTFLSQFNLTGEEHFYLKLKSTVPRCGGLGSSAALVVAAARAFDEYLKTNLGDERINQIAYEAEKYFHKTPSGVDNTVAAYGGLLWFQRNLAGGPNLMENLALSQPVEIVLGNSGVSRDTGDIVAGVRERREKDPAKYAATFSKAESLVHEAKAALLEGNLNEVGLLMNDNHRLLQEIEVSSPELDLLCKTALENGALGAKLTGAGGGGFMVALTPGKKLQNKVAGAIEKTGYEAIGTKIGV
jgi:mevalonate kinase